MGPEERFIVPAQVSLESVSRAQRIARALKAGSERLFRSGLALPAGSPFLPRFADTIVKGRGHEIFLVATLDFSRLVADRIYVGRT